MVLGSARSLALALGSALLVWGMAGSVAAQDGDAASEGEADESEEPESEESEETETESEESEETETESEESEETETESETESESEDAESESEEADEGEPEPEPEQEGEHVEVVVAPSEQAAGEDGDAGAVEGGGVEGRGEDVTDADRADLAPEDEGAEGQDEGEVADARTFFGEVTGAYRLRYNYLTKIPLQGLERAGIPDELGQNHWGGQWLRLHGEIGLQEEIKLVGEIDLIDGVIFGDTTAGVHPAERPRDDITAFEGEGVEPRSLYLEWLTPIGLFRGGLMGSDWGLGIVANDGSNEPVFGDYRYGDRVIRLAYATKPLGAESPYTIAVAGDVVFDDLIADIRNEERAYQAILALFYEKDERTIGLYGVYRNQQRPIEDRGMELGQDEKLEVFVADLYARWDWPEPSGGKIFGAFEGAYIFGDTTFTRTVDRKRFDVEQFLAAGQLGRLSDSLDVVFEGGYASGDANTEDGAQRRATFDPDHRVGLILFPELIAWQTARAAALAQSAELFARPSPGTDLIPTNGGVAGAFYLFPYSIIKPVDWMDLRFGMVWARASSNVVDPFRQGSESRSRNYRGGDPRAKDLGVELDGAIRFRGELPYGVEATGGVEGGVLFPGNAFDDADGDALWPIGMVRVRAGLKF